MSSKRLIVIIEDDALQRVQAAELFELAGMGVQAFATGDEAIAFVRDHEDDVACIFTDLRLGGGTDGVQVARYMSAALPKIPVVLTSGDLPERPAGLPDSVRMVAKPWQPYDVINAVRDAEMDDS